MAKPYKEGKSWSFRLRMSGEDIYRSGFSSQAAANQAMQQMRATLKQKTKEAGAGPRHTTLAQAFSAYARERLPFLKGADKDANRINRYLRPQGLPTIKLTEIINRPESSTCFWQVDFEIETVRSIPNCLRTHRAQQDENSAQSQLCRTRLAAMKMSDITTHDIQKLLSAMEAEGKKAATIDKERAELRRLFNHARKVWGWRSLSTNPVNDVTTPAIDNKRNRVLTNEEWRKMHAALSEYPNRYALPLVCLMLDSAMRSCEPLRYATWSCVNWSLRILELSDSKTGKKEVPLGPVAMHVLKSLAEQDGTDDPDAKIFPTTYEAMKKAWSFCRKQAEIVGVNLHDLRHTAATRYAYQFKGDLPFLMSITGHKTVKMLMRYIHIKPADTSSKMHNEEFNIEHAPAGYKQKLLDIGSDIHLPLTLPVAHTQQLSPAENVVQVAFGRAA